ncbi:MAG: hypothetical protein AAF226_14670, partial [Verrucomicrobiota bacterium]
CFESYGFSLVLCVGLAVCLFSAALELGVIGHAATAELSGLSFAGGLAMGACVVLGDTSTVLDYMD